MTRPLLSLTLAAAMLAGSALWVRAEDATPRAGDPEAGRLVFNKCRPCHQIGEGARNQIGPVLSGVVGRKAGTYAAYSYSAANKGSGLTWDEPTIRDYLHDPKLLVPGTKMTFPGLRTEREIDDVIAYLRQFAPDGSKRDP